MHTVPDMLILGRRAFFGHAATLAATIAGAPAFMRRVAAPKLVVTHVHVLEEVMDDVHGGIRMGVEEAQHATAMFGGSVELRVKEIAFDAATMTSTPLTVESEPLQVVIPGLTSAEFFATIAAESRRAGAVVINASRRNPVVHGRCERHVFHAQPSAATLAAARAMFSTTAGGTMETWARGLTRFGADTLNKRYRAFAGRSMSSSAWCGWFAVKCAWEAALQGQAESSDELARMLPLPATRFDGHKGVPLSFGPNHELVQPLYLVRDGEVVAETGPVRAQAAAACS